MWRRMTMTGARIGVWTRRRRRECPRAPLYGSPGPPAVASTLAAIRPSGRRFFGSFAVLCDGCGPSLEARSHQPGPIDAVSPAVYPRRSCPWNRPSN